MGVCVHTRVCVCVYTHVGEYIPVCLCVCVREYTRLCVCVCILVHACVCVGTEGDTEHSAFSVQIFGNLKLLKKIASN